jgi:hypothetical protein
MIGTKVRNPRNSPVVSVICIGTGFGTMLELPRLTGPGRLGPAGQRTSSNGIFSGQLRTKAGDHLVGRFCGVRRPRAAVGELEYRCALINHRFGSRRTSPAVPAR